MTTTEQLELLISKTDKLIEEAKEILKEVNKPCRAELQRLMNPKST